MKSGYVIFVHLSYPETAVSRKKTKKPRHFQRPTEIEGIVNANLIRI